LFALLASTKASATAVPRFTPLAVIEVVVTLPNTKLSVLLIAFGCIFNIGIYKPFIILIIWLFIVLWQY
jgi:hypothetical protein